MDYRAHAKLPNFGAPYVDFVLVDYFFRAARAGVLPAAVEILIKVRKEKPNG